MTAEPLAALARQFAPDRETVSDAELLTRYARACDAAAFELLVWRHGAMVWAACRRVLGADAAAAEDASQAAFAALARHAGRVRDGGAVAAWLHRVAVRAALDLKTRRRDADLPAVHPADPRPDPARAASNREVRTLIDAAVNALPVRLRAAFVLCELEGQSNAAAAAALGCPVGTVESRLTRARQQLRDVLSARGVTPAVAVVALPAATRAALVASGTGSVSAAVKELAARAVGGSAVPVRAVAAGLLLAATAFGLAAAAPQQPPPAAPKGAKAEPPAEGQLVARKFGSARFRHAGAVHDLSFAPDGDLIASVGADHALRVWETTTGNPVFAVPRERGTFTRVAYADRGKTIVAVGTTTGGRDGELWRLDAQTGAVLNKWWLRAEPGGDLDARFDRDGARVAVYDAATRTVSVVRTADGGTLWKTTPPRGETVSAVTISPDGTTAVVATDAGWVRMYDIATNTPGLAVHQGHATFTALAVSHNGWQLAAGSKTGITAWDTRGPANETRWRSGAAGDRALAFTRDGKLLLRATSTGLASTLSADDGRLPNTCGVLGTFYTGMSNTTAVAIYTARHWDDDRVAFGTAGGGIAVFRGHSQADGKPLAGSADPPHAVERLRFAADGKTVYGWAGDWLAWDIATGGQTSITRDGWTDREPLSPDATRTARFMKYSYPAGAPADRDGYTLDILTTPGRPTYFHHGVKYKAAWYEFTADGAGVIGAGADGAIRVWNVAGGQELVTMRGHATQTPPPFRALSADGGTLVTATRNDPQEQAAVRAWHLATGKLRAAFDPGVPVAGVAVSRDARRVAALAGERGDDKATVWDTVGKELARVPQGGPGGVVALSPDGKLVAVSARGKGEVRVYDAATGAARHTLTHGGAVSGLAFAPDGRTLAVGSLDVPVTVWDLNGRR
jgi:RNA polymerase sigma factor (sigma-70 family)